MNGYRTWYHICGAKVKAKMSMVSMYGSPETDFLHVLDHVSCPSILTAEVYARGGIGGSKYYVNGAEHPYVIIRKEKFFKSKKEMLLANLAG